MNSVPQRSCGVKAAGRPATGARTPALALNPASDGLPAEHVPTAGDRSVCQGDIDSADAALFMLKDRIVLQQPYQVRGQGQGPGSDSWTVGSDS